MAPKDPNPAHRKVETGNEAPVDAEVPHPVGTGVGALAGAAASGAAIGSIAGPVGTAVGAAVGAIAGGLAGSAAAERLQPVDEDAHWRKHFKSRPYVEPDASYADYAPAYRYGREAFARYRDRSFEDAERDLEQGWNAAKGDSRLVWADAKPAVRDAWQRLADTPAPIMAAKDSESG